MAKTITQKVVFKNTTTKVLYELYMDAKKHAILTGAKTKIKAKVGAKFVGFGGEIKGRMLQLEENKFIVQSWREKAWSKSTLDSILVLSFEQKGNDAELSLVQVNVPDKQADNVALGWDDCYWKNWRKYLTAKAEEKVALNAKDKPAKKTTAGKATKKVAKAVKKVAKKAAKKAVKK